MRRSTKVGLYPVGEGSQTMAFRSDREPLAWRSATRCSGVITLRASHDAATGRDVNTSDGLVMSLELITQLKGVSSLSVELDGGVAGNSERAAVGRERVVGNWVMEKMMNLGRRHDDNKFQRQE